MCKSGKNQTGRERDPLPVWANTSKKTSEVEKKLPYTNKSYYMVFHRARIKLTNIDIVINGSKLQSVKCVNYLGLMVDQKLIWIDHIAHVKHKVAQGLGIINKAKPFLTKKASGTCTIHLYTHISHLVWKFGVMQQLLICYLCVYFK